MPQNKEAQIKLGRAIVNRRTAEAVLQSHRSLTKEAAHRHSSSVQRGQYSALTFLDELEKVAEAEDAGISFDEYASRNPLGLDEYARS